MGELVIKQDARREFIDTLCELAEVDDSIVFIVPDVGFLYVDKFKDKFPDRYFNLGVTEEAIMAIAAGMALSGLKPYVYSMINFIAFRPFEMVRNCIAMHKANVKLLGVKGSSTYKFYGFSHNIIFDEEDLYHLKPYLDCYIPETNLDVRNIILDTYQNTKPAYIRLQ